MFSGRCLCGGIRFSVKGDLQPIQLCHCGDCRRAQGAPFASNMPVTTDAFELHSGMELLQHFESSPGKERAFCSRCGSPVYSRKTSRPGVLRIRAGLFEQPLPVRPVFHQFVSDKANWWEIDDDLPRFAAAPP
jgi:hypothetical protein